ncbi:MAG: hypothetical protein RIR70_1877 [Pseudomonadota bacterium]|jgi:CDP-4-dehydro-6-deoxyglucose reductase
MSVQVTLLPSGHSYTTTPDETILESALAHGYTLPYGCRDGACGSCKGKLVSGEIDYGRYSPGALSETEKKLGAALFCCARPLTDITIECREVSGMGDIQVKKLPARVESLQRAAPDVMIITLKLPTQERLQFLAGQYLDILLKDGRRRSFSMANPPHSDAFIELHIRHVPGGHFTDHVFGQMKVRDILRFEGPLGTFFLREESNKPIILLAGGTGFAPIKSIIEHAIHKGIERPMTLYWGARDEAGLYLRELAEGWVRDVPDFKFVPVLSEASWGGRQGLVHEAVMADHPDLSGHEVYACGAPAMIEAAKRDFVARCGLPVDAFFADVFSYAGA